MKKLLLLGGSAFALPVIDIAHKLGVYVITCDYLPNNIAHKYSDEYRNVSITDKETVLAVAQELEINGVMSFACDPGVVTAAYVAEKMGLPTVPYASALILQDKGLFRRFLLDNGLNTPNFKVFDSKEECLNSVDEFEFPVIVKPTDSAGSKGVSRVKKIIDLSQAVDYAIENGRNGKFIVEEFIELSGYQSTFDCFSVDNELVYYGYSDQQFDEKSKNVYTPQGVIFPTNTMPREYQENLTMQLRKLIKLLNLGTSIYNVESRVGRNGKAYIMECSPRAGGNRIAELLDIANNQHLIENNVRLSLGMELLPIQNVGFDAFYCYYSIHSLEEGRFKQLYIDESIKDNVIYQSCVKKAGDIVEEYSGANKTLGIVFLKFDRYSDCIRFFERATNLVKVILL